MENPDDKLSILVSIATNMSSVNMAISYLH